MTELYPAERPKVGLALSGAVMRGAAHIGVLMALERAHIPIDFVAGASAGSLVGAMLCAGFSAAEMVDISATMHWRNFARPTLSGKGFLSFSPLERWFVNLIGDINFEDLSRPFAVSATNLSLGTATIFKHGKLSDKVHASCAVPTFAVPVEIDGYFFCDGGVSNNLPVAALRKMGANYVIAVDLFVPTLRRKLGAFGFGLAAIETLVRRSGGGIDAADCVISPPELAGVSYLRTGKKQNTMLIKLGEKAMAAKIPDIQSALELVTKEM